MDNNFEDNNTFISKSKYEELKSFEVLPGDILITTRGSIGKVAIVPTCAPKGVLHPCVIKFRISSNIYSEAILRHIFNETEIAIHQILDMSNSTTIEVLYSNALKNIWLPRIPKEEWQEIEQCIERVAVQIDSVINKKQQLLTQLESYKKSVIYEYVTGKREVPECQ